MIRVTALPAYHTYSHNDDVKASSGSYEMNGLNAFWALRPNETRHVYFLNDIGEDAERDWRAWEEIFAKAGFVGGISPGRGMKMVPVITDIEDPLLELVQPYKNNDDEEPTRPVSFVKGANVVELVKGDDGKVYENHRILVFTWPRWKKFLNAVEEKKDVLPGFSLKGQAWAIITEGAKAGETLSLRKLDGAPAIDLPAVADITQLLEDRRQRIFNHIQNESGADLSAWSAPLTEESAAPEDSVITEDVAESLANFADASSLYASMTDDRLKSTLKRAGIAVNPAWTRDQLIEVAQNSL